jgi:hypothetical protein
MQAPPRVLISYAQDRDDPEHGLAVRRLWEFLRSCGIDARLDLPAAAQRRDWALWMAEEIRLADMILVVASVAYRERAEDRSGPNVGRGVQWEARLIRDAFYGDQQAVGRYVPVILPGQTVDGVPDFLAPNTCTVYHVADFTVEGAESLLRVLTDQPDIVEPPLGQRPTLPPRPASSRPLPPQQPLPTRPAAVYNNFTGNASGTVIQAGSIGSVTNGRPDAP